MKYAIVTFGCRVNQADSLEVERGLRAEGAVSTPLEHADVVVVNTCSVTSAADQGARQVIRRVGRVNPQARVVVTGCYATRSPEDVLALGNVACAVPNSDKPNLVRLLRVASIGAPPGDAAGSEWADGRPISTAGWFGAGEGSCGAPIEPGIAGRTAFTLRVQTGCDEPCTYCIIPATRGRPRSVPPEAVLREVAWARAAGFRELVLTGVHLGSYGRDLCPPASLFSLLRAACEAADEDTLFRISSLEPMDCRPELIDLVAAAPCFAPHFHLPLQHASDRVLAAMRRPYTLSQYADLVDRIRRRLPAAAIGTDVIVGFPGESDEDFGRLAAYLETSPLTHVHVFPYSDRPGTVAASLRDRPPGAVVRARAGRIRDVGRQLWHRFRVAQIGTVHRALTLEDGTMAVTGNYLKVRVPPGRGRNEWIRLRIVSEQDGELLSSGPAPAIDDQLTACCPDVTSPALSN